MKGNALQNLGMFIEAIDKASKLSIAEIAEQPNMKADIKKIFEVHNIEGVLNQLTHDLREQFARAEDAKNLPAMNTNALLRAYAQREHERLKGANAQTYFTKIVGEDTPGKFTRFFKALARNAKTEIPQSAPAEIEKQLETVFNTVWADGALKINIEGDPSLLNSYMDYTPYRVNYAAYLSVPTLSEMVDRPLDLVFKKFAKVKSKNKKFTEVAEQFFKDEQIPSVCRDAVFNAVLSPRGSLTVPILKNRRLHFNSFNDTQFSYGLAPGYDVLTAPYSSTRVGPIYCLGAELKHGTSAFFLCPGFEPLFGIGLNRVPVLRQAADAWNLYVHVLKILLVRSQVLIEKMEGDIQTDTMLKRMKTMLQNLTQTMGVSSVTEQPRGTTLDILNNNIGPGTADIASVFKEFVGAVTGVAPEYFFGGSNANYSMSAFNIASTNENLRARYQVRQLEPLLRFMLNTAIFYDERFKGLGINENDFEIEFEPIYDETGQEKADLIGKKTETLIRQREYSELETAFKQLGLLDEEVDLSEFAPDHDGDDATQGEGGKGEQAPAGQLTKPLS